MPVETSSAEREEAIMEEQTRNFLKTLASSDRAKLPEAEYSLYLPQVEKEVAVLESGSGTENRRKIERLRDEIFAALETITEGHYEVRQGQQVWIAHGDKPVPLPGDEKYHGLNTEMKRQAKKFATSDYDDPEIELADARSRQVLQITKDKISRTPRGKLDELYARLDTLVGKD